MAATDAKDLPPAADEGADIGLAAAADASRAPSVAKLPGYSRSLLRIRVPVTVTLAAKRQPLGRIVELGPGAIIHFPKSCEEMLDLEIGGQAIGQGEPIKVGDKFGIRLTSLSMPPERFVALGKPAKERR